VSWVSAGIINNGWAIGIAVGLSLPHQTGFSALPLLIKGGGRLPA